MTDRSEPPVDPNWRCVSEMGIEETRTLYNVICGYQEVWPGIPMRPPEENAYLNHMRTKLFAMITEYNYTHQVGGVDES